MLEDLNKDDNDHTRLWKWKARTSKSKINYPIHGQRDVVFTDDTKALDFAENLEMQFKTHEETDYP